MSERAVNIASWLIISVCSLVFGGYVLSGGLMTTADSEHYVACSYHLFHSGELIGSQLIPYTAFPPLYPMVLTFSHYFVHPLTAMAVLHVVLFVVNGLLIWSFFREYIHDNIIALLGLAITLVHTAFVVNHVFIWSEAFFYTLCIPWFFITLKAKDQLSVSTLFSLLVISLLLEMQRKTGFIFVLTSSLFLIASQPKDVKRWVWTGLYTMSALSFTAYWRYRAQQITGGFMYDKHFSLSQTWLAMQQEITELGSWMMPIGMPDALKWLSVIAAIGGMIYAFRHTRPAPAMLLCLLLLVLYSGSIIAFMTFYKLSQTIDIRVLGSILPFILLPVALSAERLQLMNIRWKYALLLSFSVVMTYNLLRTYKNLELWKGATKKTLPELVAEH